MALEKHAQIISTDMKEILERRAEEKGLSLEMEIALRLLVSMELELNEGRRMLMEILDESDPSPGGGKGIKKQECQVYYHELQRLRLYLENKAHLPRNYKEEFTVIDVKKETPWILEEIERKRRGLS
jgi:hypothetical protein